MLSTKKKELFSDSWAWTPSPQAKMPGSVHGFARFNIESMIKGLWASSARMRPLTCHLSHHFAYMKCHSFALKVKLLLGWKERGGYALQSLIMTNHIKSASTDPQSYLEKVCIASRSYALG